MTAKDVKRIRVKLGLTQAELAALFGFAENGVIGNIETGHRNPSRIMVTLLSLLDSLSKQEASRLVKQIQPYGHLSQNDSRVSGRERDL